MRVCAITLHLPPEQAANALLPGQIADGLRSHGVTTAYVSHPPLLEAMASEGPDITLVPRRGRGRLARTKAGAVLAAAAMARGLRRSIRVSDLVHLHGNGFLIETAHVLARHYRKPTVITLYGTDIWHYDERRHTRFGRAVRQAGARVFYSRGLLHFAQGLGLAPEPSTVIYAPVPAAFRALDPTARAALRDELGIGQGRLLLTVKRLHEVAGYDVLLKACAEVARVAPDVRLWIVGSGELRHELEALATALGIASRVRFLGLIPNDTLWRVYGAADLFVLPSRLESWGTVTLEALACGTRVVATDTAGGLEVHSHFPDDVMVAPKEDPAALAAHIAAALARGGRVSDASTRLLRAEFSVSGCAAKYLDVYKAAVHAR